MRIGREAKQKMHVGGAEIVPRYGLVVLLQNRDDPLERAWGQRVQANRKKGLGEGGSHHTTNIGSKKSQGKSQSFLPRGRWCIERLIGNMSKTEASSGGFHCKSQ